MEEIVFKRFIPTTWHLSVNTEQYPSLRKPLSLTAFVLGAKAAQALTVVDNSHTRMLLRYQF